MSIGNTNSNADVVILNNALWVSRHAPTDAQLIDARKMGFEIKFSPEASRLGGLELKTDQDVTDWIDSLVRLLDDEDLNCDAVMGVMPVPIREQLTQNLVKIIQDVTRTSSGLATQEEHTEMSCMHLAHMIPVYESWNILRSAEGGKPTFMHKKWCLTGYLE